MRILFTLFLLLLALSNAPANAQNLAQNNNGSITLRPAPFLHDQITIRTAQGDEYKINVELALTEQQQARGLMFREFMALDSGMLFLFKDESPRRFWMKNTLIPLDILFIHRNGEIGHIHENARPHDLSGIPSNGTATAVLELNAGQVKARGIAKGDKVIHPVFATAIKQKSHP